MRGCTILAVEGEGDFGWFFLEKLDVFLCFGVVLLPRFGGVVWFGLLISRLSGWSVRLAMGGEQLLLASRRGQSAGGGNTRDA